MLGCRTYKVHIHNFKVDIWFLWDVTWEISVMKIYTFSTGNVPFFFFQMIVVAKWFVNMTKTFTGSMSFLNTFFLFSIIEIHVFLRGKKTVEDHYTDRGPQAINPFYSIYCWWWVPSYIKKTWVLNITMECTYTGSKLPSNIILTCVFLHDIAGVQAKRKSGHNL